jgi:hypothetical protein
MRRARLTPALRPAVPGHRRRLALLKDRMDFEGMQSAVTANWPTKDLLGVYRVRAATAKTEIRAGVTGRPHQRRLLGLG